MINTGSQLSRQLLAILNSRKETAQELGQFDEAETVQGYIDQLKNYPVAMQVFLI